MTAPSMAEVLAEHRFVLDFWGDPLRCQCGGGGRTQAQMDAHVAEALATAGFGHVASVEQERDKYVETALYHQRLHSQLFRESQALLARAETAEAQVARVRALVDEWENGYNSPTASSWASVHAERLRAALDGPVK